MEQQLDGHSLLAWFSMLPDVCGKKGKASHLSPINIYHIHEADFFVWGWKSWNFFVLEKVKLVFLEGKGE